jgi:hypothetical protein
MVWWRTSPTPEADEDALKAEFGRPEALSAACNDAGPLRRALVAAAGQDTWEAGYIEGVFDVGNHLQLIFGPRFARIWAIVGLPPGPWQAPKQASAAPRRPAR